MNKKTIEKVRKSLYAQDIENYYKNLVYLSGWVIDQPRIIKHDKTGKESVSFVIAQFKRDSSGYAYMNTFHLMSYVGPVVETIKKMKKISMIICDCQLQFNAKTHKHYPQVYDLKVECELPYDLDPESEN